jgi:hypothetical protein
LTAPVNRIPRQDSLENASFGLVGGLIVCGLLFADVCETMAMPNSRDYATAAAMSFTGRSPSKLVYVPEQSYRVDQLGNTIPTAFALTESDEQGCGYRHMTMSGLQEDVDRVEDVNDAESEFDGLEVVERRGNVHHHHIDFGHGTLSWVIAFMLSLHSLVTGAAFGMAPKFVLSCAFPCTILTVAVWSASVPLLFSAL